MERLASPSPCRLADTSKDVFKIRPLAGCPGLSLVAIVRSRTYALQRFFSTFPAGWPGVGLLVLRLAAGSVAIGEGLARFEQARPSLDLPAAVVGIGAGLLLLAGFLTPFAGATLAVLNTSIALFWIAPVDSAHNSLFVAAVDAGLAFLGPGFLSIDARLFGRHRVIIPRTRK